MREHWKGGRMEEDFPPAFTFCLIIHFPFSIFPFLVFDTYSNLAKNRCFKKQVYSRYSIKIYFFNIGFAIRCLKMKQVNTTRDIQRDTIIIVFVFRKMD